MAVWGLRAQGTAPPPLVYLYPDVTDSSGQPVTDLAAGDFKIADQGKSQAIFFFRRPDAKATAALGTSEYANRSGGVTPHSIAILFDLLNEADANRLDTFHWLSKSIPQLESAAQVYFYMLKLDGELVPIRPIGAQDAGDASWLGTFDQKLSKAIGNANLTRPAGIDREDWAKRTYHQIEVISHQLATLPGRRDILWITNMLPSITNSMPCSGDWVDCGLYVSHMSVTLEHDGAAVNPYYASGVPQPTTSDDLEQMGLLTGGRSYYLTDIRKVIEEVSRSDANRYEIAYAPPAENWDNKFHKIRITCARKGAKLQVRERYYALPDSRSPADRQKEALMAAYQRPFDAANIGLRVKVTPAAASVHLDIHVDAADLLLREQGGKFAGAATLALTDWGAAEPSAAAGLQARPIGEPAASSFALEMNPEQHDRIMRDGIQLSLDHAITAAVQKVRLLVMDTNTNAIGSVTFPVR